MSLKRMEEIVGEAWAGRLRHLPPNEQRKKRDEIALAVEITPKATEVRLRVGPPSDSDFAQNFVPGVAIQRSDNSSAYRSVDELCGALIDDLAAAAIVLKLRLDETNEALHKAQRTLDDRTTARRAAERAAKASRKAAEGAKT